MSHYKLYSTTYRLPNVASTCSITVEADCISHAEQLVMTQTGARRSDIQPFQVKENNRGSQSNTNSGGDYSFELPSFGTMIKTVALGGLALWGLQFVPTDKVQEAFNTNKEMIQMSQPNNTQIQHSSHHIDESIPEFFNTEFQEDVVDDLGQDWDN